jgi:hypothetical protein
LAATVSDIKADTAEVPLEANPEPVLAPVNTQAFYCISDGNDVHLYSTLDDLANVNTTQFMDGK